jgi:nitrogen regulatory protein PII
MDGGVRGGMRHTATPVARRGKFGAGRVFVKEVAVRIQ